MLPAHGTLENILSNARNDNPLNTRWLANQSLLDELTRQSLDWAVSERAASYLTYLDRSVEVNGANPFGEVHSGCLKLTGCLQEALVRYNHGSLERQVSPHRFARYELVFENQEAKDCKIPGLGEDIRGTQLPFFADYALSEYGDDHLQEGARVRVLWVLVNVGLVLRELKSGNFRRIGIFRAPVEFERIYGRDFSSGSREMEVRVH